MTLDPATNTSRRREMAGVHHARLLASRRRFSSASGGCSRRGCATGRCEQDETGDAALHAQDAFPFRLGHRRLRADADVLRRALDAGASNTNGSPRFTAFISSPAAPGSALATVYVIAVLLQRQRILDRVLQRQLFLFHRRAVLRVHACFRPTTNSRNTSSSGTPTCRRKPSGISSAKTARGGALSMILIFGHFFVPFFRAAAGEGQDQFQNHPARLRSGRG